MQRGTAPQRRLGGLVALLVAISVGAAIGFAPTAGAVKTPDVYINGDSVANYKFTPRTIEVRRGRMVKWQWDSIGAHNVTFRKLHKSSITGASENYRLRFKRRGTFKYLCTVHGFRGKVVVKRR